MSNFRGFSKRVIGSRRETRVLSAAVTYGGSTTEKRKQVH